MTKLRLESNALFDLDQQLKQVQRHLQYAYQNLQNDGNEAIDPLGITRNEKMALRQRCQRMMTDVNQIQCFISQSIAAYEQVERSLNMTAKRIADNSHSSTHAHDALRQTLTATMPLLGTALGTSKSALRYHQWHTEWFDRTHDFTYRGFKNRKLRSLINDGIRADGEAGIHLINISRFSRSKQILNHVGFQIGNAEIGGHVQGKLISQKQFDPQVRAEISAKASLIRGIIETGWHNEVLEVGLQASGNVGVAQAKGKAVISKDELTLKGDVGVAALQGEVKGTIELLGATITITAEGEVGGMGIGSEFSLGTGSFEVGGKLSCLLGGGIHVKVDW